MFLWVVKYLVMFNNYRGTRMPVYPSQKLASTTLNSVGKSVKKKWAALLSYPRSDVYLLGHLPRSGHLNLHAMHNTWIDISQCVSFQTCNQPVFSGCPPIENWFGMRCSYKSVLENFSWKKKKKTYRPFSRTNPPGGTNFLGLLHNSVLVTYCGVGSINPGFPKDEGLNKKGVGTRVFFVIL